MPRQYVAAEFLERLEVFRGANTFLNGAAPGGSGIGGEFNLVPKRAPDVDIKRLTVGYENQTQGYAAGDLSRRFGDERQFGLRVNAARRDGGAGLSPKSMIFSVWPAANTSSAIPRKSGRRLVQGDVAPLVSGSVKIVNGDEIFAPFRSRQYEVGAKYDTGTIGGTLALFRVNKPSALIAGDVYTHDGDKNYWASVGGEPGANYLVLAEPRTIKLSLSVDL